MYVCLTQNVNKPIWFHTNYATQTFLPIKASENINALRQNIRQLMISAKSSLWFH